MNFLNSFREGVNKETKTWKTNHLRRTKCTFEDIEFQERRTLLYSILFCFVLFLSHIFFFRNYMEKNIPQSNAWTFWIIYRENQQKKWKSENKLFEKNKRTFEDIVFQDRRTSLLFFVSFCSFSLPFLFWIWKVFLLSFIKGNLV